MSMALACCDATTTSFPFSDTNPKKVIERTAYLSSVSCIKSLLSKCIIS
jgi:hypothetical protein